MHRLSPHKEYSTNSGKTQRLPAYGRYTAEGDEKFSVEDDARELDEDYDRAVQRDAAENEPTERGRSFLPKREQSGTDYGAIATAEIERRARDASLQQRRRKACRSGQDRPWTA
ncbi:MAG: hypothetical protein CW335_03350 [Clostridiales bacterium]|nr:hypothetical protein [Clostridiales bacterium]